MSRLKTPFVNPFSYYEPRSRGNISNSNAVRGYICFTRQRYACGNLSPHGGRYMESRHIQRTVSTLPFPFDAGFNPLSRKPLLRHALPTTLSWISLTFPSYIPHFTLYVHRTVVHLCLCLCEILRIYFGTRERERERERDWVILPPKIHKASFKGTVN